MKKQLTLALCSTALIALCSCSEQDFGKAPEQLKAECDNNGYSRSIDEVRAIANGYLAPARTRGADMDITPVYGEAATSRSGNESECYAYICNADDNNGFVLVSADRRVNPVLAYSTSGTFKYEEDMSDPVYATVIRVLPTYVQNSIESYSGEPLSSSGLTETCGGSALGYRLGAYWCQEDPYNEYVVKKYPGCLTGCVPLASARVMLFGQQSFVYHNVMFNCVAIRKALFEYDSHYDDIQLELKEYGKVVSPELVKLCQNNSEALKFVKSLILWVGEDINTQYGPTASSASTSDAHKLIVEQEVFDVWPIDSMSSYRKAEVMRRLCNNEIIQIRANFEYDGKVPGHSWVLDGASYCFVDPTIPNQKPDFSGIFFDNVREMYVSCDWGSLRGKPNGYYLADIFEDKTQYMDVAYFSIKNDSILYDFKKPGPFFNYPLDAPLGAAD